MSEFKEALSSISPIPYSSLPSQDELPEFLKTSFHHAEVILNSIPTSDSSATFLHPSLPDSATNASETLCDQSLVPLVPISGRDPGLQKLWGKPYKLSTKDNPLGVAVYKMAAHDRHGAWFSRRSLHQGIGFEKFRAGMRKEFLHSLKVKGGPGSGAVRGVAADRRIVKKNVEGVGKVEVWQTSSAFPGPVTPRESLTLVLTSDNALSESSAPISSSRPPRHHLTISRPTVHPSAPDRPNLVKLAYESAELIREVPLSAISPNGGETSGEPLDPEANPVEWLMITRSDPGGGIPKFMVERGTPGSIVGDVTKWLDWATSLTGEDLQKTDDDEALEEAEADLEIEQESLQRDVAENREQERAEADQEASGGPLTLSGTAKDKLTEDGTRDPAAPGSTGIVSKFTEAFGHAVSDYLPYALQNHQEQLASRRDDDAASTTSTSSSDSAESGMSFASAVMHNQGVVPSALENNNARASTDAFSSTSSINNDSSQPDGKTDKKKTAKEQDQHARELAKLHAKRVALESKRNKDLENASKRAAAASEKSEKEAQKAAERHQKEKKRQEERYAKELEKLEKKREKELRVAEEKRKKTEAKDELTRVKRDRDEWKIRAEVGEREAELLAKQVENLQRINTSLVAGLGGLEGGQEILGKVREESKSDGRASTGQSSGRGSQKSGVESH